MQPYWLLITILIPLLSGALLPAFRLRERKKIRIYVLIFSCLTSAMAWLLILFCPEETFHLIRFTEDLSMQFRLDGLGRFFTGLVATLWPLTVLYAFEYLKDDPRESTFFAFFTLSYSATLGISFSGNLFTLYCFYELLTLATVPLVMHTRTRLAVRAARTYFGFSLGGAAFALISIIYLLTKPAAFSSPFFYRMFYLSGFLGFGVKSAIFPLCGWLPKASVAPTPVTALLHAVAVVKSGVFAIIRLTYYNYDIELLRGSFAQYITIGLAIFTVVYGTVRAVKETHWKRRLAYSTIANLSYILFGVLLMTEAGLQAGMLHMAFHAEIKILAFFAAGAVLHMTGREYLPELDGLARKMPWTFSCFLVAALALTGIPPFAGFVSKWHLLTAAAAADTPVAYLGAAAILAAALMTAFYCFTVVRRAFFPDKDADLAGLENVRETSLLMLVPMVILAAGILITGLNGGRIADVFLQIIQNRIMW